MSLAFAAIYFGLRCFHYFEVCPCSPVILDTEQKVAYNILRQMSLCRFYGDSSKCEMRVPPGLGVWGAPWNPAEWIGMIVARNCAFTPYSQMDSGSQVADLHKWTPIPAYSSSPLVPCIRKKLVWWSNITLVRLSLMSPLKKVFLHLHFNLCLRQVTKSHLIFATGQRSHFCCLHLRSSLRETHTLKYREYAH